jgi:hypothetical protein
MGRLFYDKSNTSIQPRVASGEEKKVNDYLDKVSKLIPSEVIAGYLAMFGLVPLVQKTDIHSTVFWIIFWLCQILTPIYLNSQSEKGKPKRNHLIISSIAFTVWAYVTTGKTLVPDFYDAAIGSIILIAFSLISAIIPLTK